VGGSRNAEVGMRKVEKKISKVQNPSWMTYAPGGVRNFMLIEFNGLIRVLVVNSFHFMKKHFYHENTKEKKNFVLS
jgi:hypothetical protein